MSLLWHRKQHIKEEAKADKAADVAVDVIKSDTHQAISQANKDIKNLNDLLKANGITFKIHLVTNGHSHGR